MSERDTLAPNARDSDPNARKDREVGRALRYATLVAVIVAAVVTAIFQTEAAVDLRMDRAVANKAERSDLNLRDLEVASELKLLRSDMGSDKRELAKVLERIDERLGNLEKRRAP